MQRSVRQRAAAILLAVLAQSTLIALYILPRVQESTREPAAASLLFIQPMPATEVVPPEQNRQRVASLAGPRPMPVSPALTPAEPGAPPETPSPEAITQTPPTAPGIDWNLAMQKSLPNFIQREARQEEFGNPLDSKPKVLKLPENTSKPAVTAERLDNGDIITRHRLTENIEIVCEHRQVPLAEHFEATSIARAALCRTHSLRTDLEGLEGIEKLKPGYLSRPLPKPVPAKERE